MLQQIILILDFSVAFALILWALLSYGRRKEEQQANYYLKLQKALMDEHYSVLKSQTTMVRHLRHDLANHVQTLKALDEGGKTEEYRKYEEQLKNLYTILRVDGACPNFALDSILVRKKEQCEEARIRLETRLLTVDGRGIDQTELLLAFYELLEYGIAQAEKGAEKELRVSGSQENGWLFLEVRCPAPREKRRRGRGRTPAGLRQSAMIAEKYDGGLSVEQKDGVETVYWTAKPDEESGR